jgi:patatin-related protein
MRTIRSWPSPHALRRRSHSPSSRCAWPTSTKPSTCGPSRNPTGPPNAPTTPIGGASTATTCGPRASSRGRSGKEGEDALAERFRHRAFGDGGYLDNKPFTHAVAAVKQRRSDFPVDRKLVYIEPAPERPGRDPKRDGKPDALDNVLAALLVLPRYETIREDIEQVRELNRLVDRVRVMLIGRETDGRHWGKVGQRRASAQIEYGKTWRDEDLSGMLRRYGLAYGSYHRLKVAVLTDELALLVATLLGLPEESEERVAIRYLIGAWRSATYTLFHSEGGPERPSENSFLFELDLGWRFRRLSFLRSRADDLYAMAEGELERSLDSIDELAATRRRLVKLDEAGREELRSALLMIKWGVNHAHIELRKAETQHALARAGKRARPSARGAADRTLRALGDRHPGERRGTPGKPPPGWPRRRPPPGARGVRRASCGARWRRRCDRRHTLVRPFSARCPKGASVELPRRSSRWSPSCGRDARQGGPLAQAVVSHFYRYFEEYDLISFPILYHTGVGEADPVEVIRISPEDADLLFDEQRRLGARPPRERAGGSADRLAAGQKGRPKLAGTLLGNFGAFLAEGWRVNDMLWGRLDAAEQLISALLPEDRRLRAELVEEAQVAILAEELAPGPAPGARSPARVNAPRSGHRRRSGRSGSAARDLAGEVRGERARASPGLLPRALTASAPSSSRAPRAIASRRCRRL